MAGLLYWAAVWDKLSDLPVYSVCRADVGGWARGKLLIEDMAFLTHRGTLFTVALIETCHLAIGYAWHYIAVGWDG